MLLLVKSNFFPWVIFTFLNCTDGTKSRKTWRMCLIGKWSFTNAKKNVSSYVKIFLRNLQVNEIVGSFDYFACISTGLHLHFQVDCIEPDNAVFTKNYFWWRKEPPFATHLTSFVTQLMNMALYIHVLYSASDGLLKILWRQLFLCDQK